VEEEVRSWPQDTDDRCPVCFIPPSAWHLAGECIYSGQWNGPGTLPDPAAPGGTPAPGGSPGSRHGVPRGDSGSCPEDPEAGSGET
jgi:hypothetical protein